MTLRTIKKFIKVLLSGFLLISLQFCAVNRQTSGTSKSTGDVPTVFYNTDISPIMSQKCTPCHFPEKGKKKMLDSYSSVKNNIDDILNRIQMKEDEKGFMPFKSKKEPLTTAQINLFKDWLSQGMHE